MSKLRTRLRRLLAQMPLLPLMLVLPLRQTTPAAPPVASLPDTPWKKAVPGGTARIELVGVTLHPEAEQEWSTPDGTSRLTQPPLDPQPGRRLAAVFTEPFQFEALFHLTRLPSDTRISCDLEYKAKGANPRYSLAGTDTVSWHGKPYGTIHDRLYLVRVGCYPPKGSKATIRVGLCAGAGEQFATWTPETAQGVEVGTDGEVPIRLESVEKTRDGGSLMVKLSLPRRHGPLRLAGSADYDFSAQKSDGTVVEGVINENDLAKDGPPLKATFPSLALIDVVRFRLIAHPYQWVAFENVSLRDLSLGENGK